MMKDNEVMRKNDKAMKKIGKAMIKNGLIFGVLIILTTLNAWSQDTIRVLAIGNSFSVDAVENNLFELGQEQGVTFIIGNLYIGGCSLERHWENAQNNKADYSYRKIDSEGKKTTTPNATLIQGITDEEWDYITFQQNSPNSGFIDTYFPYLTQLTDFTKKQTSNPRVKFAFHQTWAYANDSNHSGFPRYNSDQAQMYRAIVKTSREAAREAGIERIIPVGTAIQNGRSSFIGDRFCRDGYHLSLDLGRYTAACTWFEFLTGKSVVGNPFSPRTITPLEATTVQRAAHEAVLNPFEITPIDLENELASSGLASSDIIERNSELSWMLSVLPPDRTNYGRVSFLDKTFNDWLRRTGELPPDFDEMPSIPFLPNPLIIDEGGSNKPVKSMNQWNSKKEWMREQLARYITGTTPPPPDNLQAKILEERKDGEVTLRIVELSFGPDQKATLTLELMIPPGEGPFPVFLTNWNHREWAQIAVRRGYIGCLYAGADTKDDTEVYSEIWAGQYDFTRLMRRAYGASRAVDYLFTLPYVDRDKIGITGHSRNGKTSLMAAAFDDRIGACIPSSGGTGAEVPWRYNAHKYDVEDIALLACAQPAWLHPRLRFFIGREHKLPVDQNSFMSLIAPRGLMLSTAVTESASNIFGIEQAYHSTKKVYEFLDAEENIAIASRYGLHGVNANDIEGYVDFFDFVFHRTDRAPENRLFYNYSFDEWRASSGNDVNPLNHGRTVIELDAYASSRQQWIQGKQTVIENLQWLLGEEPAGVTNPGPGRLDKGGAGENRFGSFLTRPRETGSMKVMAITPYNGFGDNLFGYLYYPADEAGKPVNKNLPVVIYLHEYDYSKGFSSMSFDHEIQSVFENITKRGYAVFAFDMIGFGNRLEEGLHFYDRYPRWSKMGKMVADTKAAVDALTHLDFVDGSKIVVSGYSLGGTVALLSAALDERIAGVVSVAGFTPMRTNTLDRGTEGIMSYSHLHGLIPKLGFFVGHENQIPVDFEEIIASIAPRPALLIAPERDKDAHPGDIRDLVEKVKKVYELHDASENHVQLFMPDDYNRFSTVSRQKMYSWLEKLPDLPVVTSMDEPDTGKALAEDAAWCWFSDPRAVYHHGEKEAVYFGYINSKGDVKIQSLDLKSNATHEFTLHEKLQIDDHNVPAIVLLPDGKLLAFYCEHNGNIFMRKSKNPEDIRAWEEEVILLQKDAKNQYCYVNPVMLSEEDNRIYLFPDFVIASPKNLHQRVWRFSDALPSTLSECIHPCSEVA
jgi:dienelactone hydrolase